MASIEGWVTLKNRSGKKSKPIHMSGSVSVETDWSRRIGALPATAARLLSVAAAAIERRDLGQARSSLIAAQALAPGHAEVLRLQGLVHHLEGRHVEATHLFRQALESHPDDALILNNLGSTLRAQGHVEAALQAFERACELRPELAAAWFNLGKALKSQARIMEARNALQRALDAAPEHLAARMALGDACKAMGEIDAAAQAWREVLRRNPRMAQAWFSLANLKTLSFDAGDLARLKSLSSDPAISEEDRVYLGFAEVKALEDLGRFPQAYAALARVNASKRKSLSWDAEAFSAHVDRIADAFRAPLDLAANRQQGAEVIFVASMPRSGSTLIEQILASHSTVEGASELPDLPAVIAEESKRRGVAFPHWVGLATADDWGRLGRDYLSRTERWRDSRPRFTDKGLFNWQYVGAVVAMLPGAKVVLCHRDPVETCFSCFHQLFARGQEFSYDLQELAAYWRDFDRLSRLWLERYPAQVFKINYEDLVSEPHRFIAELLNFCGLTPEESCLRFHESTRAVRTASAAQVRQPLAMARGRSLRYHDQLAPLRGFLGMD